MKRAVPENFPKHGARGWPVRADRRRSWGLGWRHLTLATILRVPRPWDERLTAASTGAAFLFQLTSGTFQPFDSARRATFQQVVRRRELPSTPRTGALEFPAARWATPKLVAVANEKAVAPRTDLSVAWILAPVIVAARRGEGHIEGFPVLVRGVCGLPEQLLGAWLTNGPRSREQGVDVNLGHRAPARRFACRSARISPRQESQLLTLAGFGRN